MAKIAVLGAGIMATALTFPSAENGNEIRLIGTHLDDEIIDSIKTDGTHPVLGLKIPESVKPYYFTEAAEAVEGADIIMSGVNSFGVEWAGEQLAKLAKPGQTILSITKGMHADEDGTLHILPDVLKEKMGPLADQVNWAAIVGPSIAGELAVHHLTCVTFCAEKQDVAEMLAPLYRTDYYHVWTSTDFIGNEVGSCMKNIFAFGGGFAPGILKKLGKEDDKYVMYNYAAALFGEGARELKQMVELLGGDPTVTENLGGVGDMFVTTMGGRNVRAGTYVGQGVPFSEIRNVKMKGVTLEGVAAIGVVGAALGKLTERGVIKDTDYPLVRALYEIVAHDAPLDLPWEKFFGGER
ncbi:Glycerol-3-phosphate dehydrogenase [Acidipropionibacterium acidipropionici ATCC 4875]|uniref:Glycerol-3-phosphate dehydrogenase n=1 Tax=Acidipropionibacterium acidipropionici (strain ATCC 4875 / DSM 20272 / JCM 6432 / NBRC 12425 / NCIMB 8070 / 4) TaxID=1171373 RepID=K7RUK7_ACIA4|nr:glycerol-3-phosphate dehydrogenase [Acidipropionibacterium acidipropionici]AFV88653.1 Glycerol-3-phosphate dehydrogenase [Acidipropionibacterium acidipropionici ATCC 4875]